MELANNKTNWSKVKDDLKNGKLLNIIYYPYNKDETIINVVPNNYKRIFGVIATILRKDRFKDESEIQFTNPKSKNLYSITYSKQYGKYNKYGELVDKEYLKKYGTTDLVYNGKYSVNIRSFPSSWKENISYMLHFDNKPYTISNDCPITLSFTEEEFLSLLEKVL